MTGGFRTKGLVSEGLSSGAGECRARVDDFDIPLEDWRDQMALIGEARRGAGTTPIALVGPTQASLSR